MLTKADAAYSRSLLHKESDYQYMYGERKGFFFSPLFSPHVYHWFVLMAVGLMLFVPRLCDSCCLQYLLCYVRKNCSNPTIGKYALMCHSHLTIPRATSRKHPPSTIEIAVSYWHIMYKVHGYDICNNNNCFVCLVFFFQVFVILKYLKSFTHIGLRRLCHPLIVYSCRQ